MENTVPKKYTADDFFEMLPETKEHLELHDGEIVALASPNVLHHDIATELFTELRSYIRSKGGSGKPFLAPLDVKLDDQNVVQPDVFVVCDRDKIDSKRINGAPDLVIEIMSSNRYIDLFRKLDLYSRLGVREYWIVDPRDRKTIVYFFEQTDYPQIFTFDDSIPVGIFGGELSIAISGLING